MTKPQTKRWVWRIVRGGLLIYLGLMLVFSLLQTKLIFPGAMTQGQADAVVPELAGTDLSHVDTAEGQIAILFGEPTGKAATTSSNERSSRPTVLFFYGNGMCMADAIEIFNDLRRLGNNVVLVDYPGYGMSAGKPSETGVYTAAALAHDFAVQRKGVDRHRIIAMGWSLGAAAAIDVAARERVAGLVILSPFTSMTDMARRTMPIFPTSFILKHRFENETKLAKVSCPIFIGHGSHDAIIPAEMSDRLAKVAGDKLRANLRLDSDHNDLFDVGGDALIRQIAVFIQDSIEQTSERR